MGAWAALRMAPCGAHHTRGRMCAAEGLHYGAAWRHGTAQRLQVHKLWAARARHEGTIDVPFERLRVATERRQGSAVSRERRFSDLGS